MKGNKKQSLWGKNKFCGNIIIPYVLMFIFLSTVMFTNVNAQALKGRITGKIVDSETGDAFIGANVFLQGTMIGAARDLDGNYRIEKIPSGKYSLIISMMGYTKTTIIDVLISAGEVTKIDVALKPEIIETETLKNILLEKAFNGSFGKDDELKFGKEVYLIGFPKGFFFVTRGLISPSPYKNKFLIDASFNRGFSGGAVIAINKNRGTYRYFGMANSMAYDSLLVLTPSEQAINLKYFENLPYSDDAYVKELKLVNVGLTFAFKSSVIRRFLNNERGKLRLKGHYLPEEFK